MLYTLEWGTIASKQVAAAWATELSGGQWRFLIDRALMGRRHPDEPMSPRDLSGTLDFIRYTLQSARKDKPFKIPFA